ncbi:hypothetical protein D3C85_1441190 [compost metagenome]
MIISGRDGRFPNRHCSLSCARALGLSLGILLSFAPTPVSLLSLKLGRRHWLSLAIGLPEKFLASVTFIATELAGRRLVNVYAKPAILATNSVTSDMEAL